MIKRAFRQAAQRLPNISHPNRVVPQSGAGEPEPEGAASIDMSIYNGIDSDNEHDDDSAVKGSTSAHRGAVAKSDSDASAAKSSVSNREGIAAKRRNGAVTAREPLGIHGGDGTDAATTRAAAPSGPDMRTIAQLQQRVEELEDSTGLLLVAMIKRRRTPSARNKGRVFSPKMRSISKDTSFFR